MPRDEGKSLSSRYSSMRIILFLAILLPLFTSVAASANPSSMSQTITIAAGSPAIVIKKARVDPRDGIIRGTAYLAFGYAAPFSAHIHAFGLDATGNVVAGVCENLSRNLLAPHPRRAGQGRDAFSFKFPVGTQSIRGIQLVAHTGKCPY